ncbi:MAG: hypothetical protein H6867_10770 [Rhodospirillales bacterium]|nr:hypothetical protein [Rhodospirillales bacterium]MCB9995736.1 hypothetical protein [Rhodospirillales bacterium]
MTAILDALTALNTSLDKLEIAAAQQEQKTLQTQQQDLFGGGYNMIDPAILAQKLDVTIERIEQVLREG